MSRWPRRWGTALALWGLVVAGCDTCEPDAPGAGQRSADRAGLPSDVRSMAMGPDGPCLVGETGWARCYDADGGEATRSFDGVAQLAISGAHGCILHRDRSVSCWEGEAEPEKVQGLEGARAVAAGDDHACAVVAGGRVVCWGDNARGQLGDGTTTDRDRPVSVRGLSDVTQLAAGAVHTCVLLADGTVRCWGGHARVSDVRREPRTAEELVELIPRPVAEPTPVPSVDDAERIVAGAESSCAVTSDRRLVCWPAYVGPQARASAMAWPSDALSVGVGQWGKCAVRQGGGVACWDFAAPEGSGRVVAPVAVRGVEDALEVAVGAEGACARERSGQVLCWSQPATTRSLGFRTDSR